MAEFTSITTGGDIQLWDLFQEFYLEFRKRARDVGQFHFPLEEKCFDPDVFTDIGTITSVVGNVIGTSHTRVSAPSSYGFWNPAPGYGADYPVYFDLVVDGDPDDCHYTGRSTISAFTDTTLTVASATDIQTQCGLASTADLVGKNYFILRA